MQIAFGVPSNILNGFTAGCKWDVQKHDFMRKQQK